MADPESLRAPIEAARPGPGTGGWFSRERTVAQPGFDRWRVPRANACTVTMYVMAALLGIGLVLDSLVRPVHARHHLPARTVAA